MIVDAHTHIFPPAFKRRRDELMADACFRELYGRPEARMATAEELISSMDEAGIDVSVVSAIGWGRSNLCCEHNDYIMQAVQKYPGRLIGLGMVQPLEVKSAIGEFTRICSGGLKGIGEFRPDVQGVDLADESITRPFVEALVERDAVLMFHASEPVGHKYPGKGGITPEKLYPFICSYGELVIILAHWGGGLPFYALNSRVRSVLENVYYDTAASPYLYEPGVYKQVVDLVGEEKVLFGSDYPLLEYERVFRHLNDAGLPLELKKRVLGLNAIKLYGLEQRGS